ncbi:hypothetical protein H4R21_000444 [Coemansia helicoidea]|uniref:Uncharacterized protein n=1 Tax=Coemansia helicoidea TaxID=1286919 RepID=A0ACC1LGC1_9FUNG|nr:hypothetical protein H4R21_000444 [Coemansia helicoidea]
MKLVVSVLALAAACTSIASARPFPAGRVLAPPANVRVKPNSYIVEFYDEAVGTLADQILGLANVVVDQHFNGLFNGISVSVGDAVRAEHLADISGVKRVYPNRIHTLTTQTGAKNITSSYLHTMTGASMAWSKLGLSGKGISIGIIDTGVDYTHPDLGGCWKRPNCPWQKGADLVGDDYSPDDHDPVIKPNPTPLDQCDGHGTHVAGILMARGDLVRGVARDATYGMYRIFGCPKNGMGSGTTDEIIIKAMLAAHRDGHDIISMSLGGLSWEDSPTAVVASKLVARGVVVVAAAGNEGEDGLVTVAVPSISRGAISVGSVENWDITGGPVNVATTLGARTIAKWEPESPANFFVFDKATPVVAVRDAAGSPLACAPVSQDLAGKIALVHRGECEFAVKEAVAQEAGAVGILIVNNDGAPGSPPAPDSIKIGVALIGKQDGEFIAAALRKGPVTITAPSHLYNTFKSETGGQMSTFSSYGPSPQLGMGPLLSAPGGNIWSTFPRALGSYKSLSGTSMATPYAAGAVALLKQGRPDLTPAELRQVLMASSRPVTDVRTGLPATPFQSGAGLINIADAVKSRVLVSPPFIAINDTAYETHPGGNPAVAQRTITITNTDKTRAAQLLMYHQAADSVTMFKPDGTLSDAVINGAPLDTWPPAKKAVPAGTQPQVSCSGCTQTIAPGASATVSVRITRPTALPESGRWFYGGFLSFQLQWAGDKAARSYVVPYSGYNGNYRDIPVLPLAGDGRPMFADMLGNPIPNPKALKITAKKQAQFVFSLNMPTRKVAATLVSAAGKSLGYLPYGCMIDVGRTLPSHGGYAALVSSQVTADCAGAKAVDVAPGKYRVKLTVLKLFGNPDSKSDYESRVSEEFTIA